MIDRARLYEAWARFYQGDVAAIRTRASGIEGRMMTLARRPGRIHRDYVKRELETGLGMSLGVHRQLLGRLTSVPFGGYPGGRRGGKVDNRGAAEGRFHIEGRG